MGILDGDVALRHLQPDLLLLQTTAAPFTSAWKGKMSGADTANAHLRNLAEAARSFEVPVVVLCTAAPEDTASFAPLLQLADLVLSPRSDTSSALTAMGPRVLKARDVVVRFGPGTSTEKEPAMRALAETFFAAALSTAESATGVQR